jgi:hypothetical protein
MDELRFKSQRTASRSARRLALLAALNCSAIIGSGFAQLDRSCFAAETNTPRSSSGLRSLLTDGWQQTAPMPTPSSENTSLTEITVEALRSQDRAAASLMPQSKATAKNDQTKAVPLAAPFADSASRLVPIKIDEAKQLLRAPSGLPTSSLHFADIPSRTVASKTKRIVASEAKRIVASKAKRTFASEAKRTARPFASSQPLPKLPAPDTRSQKADQREVNRISPSGPAFRLPDEVAKANTKVRSQPPQTDDFLDDSMDDLRTRALRSLATKQGFGLLNTGVNSAETMLQGPSMPASTAVLTKPQEFDTKLVVIERIASDTTSSVAPKATPRSLQIDSTIRANKLGQIAAEQISDAKSRLQRGATHSAKRLTMQAIQNLVAVQDVRQGNNENARHLDVALTAIRESADFGARFGTLDQRSLGRLVVAHKTRVLKDKDLSLVSPMRATEAYLAIAREEIVLATASVAMASDALVLLGQIESSIAPDSDTRSGAVTLSLQQAAVEVDPANSDAWLQLGTTMMTEGLTEESVAVLSRSVQLRPSRKGYERLMLAARQAQDISTMQQCRLALQNPHLKRQIPVRQLTQETFASMYKPTNAIARNSAAAKQKSETADSKTEAQPVSGKSKRFALLRSWVMPK